jgi:hypothetical protein
MDKIFMNNYEIDKKYKLVIILNKNEIECLYKITDEEDTRWNNLLKKINNRAVICDYENDLNMMFGLLEYLKYPDFDEKNQEMIFSEKDVLLLIESLDDEFEIYQKGESRLEEKYLSMLEGLKNKIRQAAIEKYGSDIIDDAHYERGKNG